VKLRSSLLVSNAGPTAGIELEEDSDDEEENKEDFKNS
jgi:hypothetical protein